MENKIQHLRNCSINESPYVHMLHAVLKRAILKHLSDWYCDEQMFVVQSIYFDQYQS